MAVSVTDFRLIGNFEYTERGTVRIQLLRAVTRHRPGPFTFVRVVMGELHAVEQAQTVTIAYHVEGPDGAIIPLRQAKPSEWPDWIRRWVDERLGGFGPGAIDESVLLAPATVTVGLDQPVLLMRPVEVRVQVPGRHIFRIVADGERVGEFPFDVFYEARPH